MYIRLGKKLTKQLSKIPTNIRKAFDNRLALFLSEPLHPQLHNHQLTGNYKGFRSINITGDWRAVFIEQIDEKGNLIVIFEVLGTHSQLYK